MTPLGEIVIVEALKDQDILVAGPSTKHEMIKVVNRLKKYCPKKILIDGALFRKSLASTSVSDAVILSTGASYSEDIVKVVEDTSDIVEQFKVQEVDDDIKDKLLDINCVVQEDLKVKKIDDVWIHTNPELLNKVLNESSRYLYLQGALTDNIIKTLINMREHLSRLTIVVNDATHILCSSNYYRKLSKMNTDVRVIHQSHLLFVSYNPTSPYGYEFNNQQLKQLLEEHIDLPCINVIEDRK